ncbi:MAG: hypothetical protein WD069_15455 [Planctomycetales bacterium]
MTRAPARFGLRHPLFPFLVILPLIACPEPAAADVALTQAPAVQRAGDKALVTFAVSEATDVEVAIVDAQGKVVRHLAAGVIGRESAPPAPLAPGLSQKLAWDGTDDAGRPAASGPFSFRVRAGYSAKLAKVIGDPGSLSGKIFGMATDEQGNLYVATGAVYSGEKSIFTIRVFDGDGKYLRTILPMPANLSAEDAAEYGATSAADGHLQPRNHDALMPDLQGGGVSAFLGNQVRDGQLWLVNTQGRIARIRVSDGKPLVWKSGAKAVQSSGGPMCWAVAPDGKSLFLAGWWNWRTKDGPRGDGVIRKIDPATGNESEFAKVDVPADSFWLKEPNGWYLFTNWGRKNGLAALHGLVVDKGNRVYVCDRVNQRIAVYDASGKLAGSTPIEWPDQIALGPDGRTIYVATRKIVDGYQAVNDFAVVKLSAAIDGNELARLELRGKNAPLMALGTKDGAPTVWLTNVGRDGERVVRIEDRGNELVEAGELAIDRGPGNIVKVWVDPESDDVYANDGWSGLSKWNGETGQGEKLPITAIDLAIGPDRNIYLTGQKGWKEPIYRCSLDLAPVPFPDTKQPLTEKEIYGRYGIGWSNKGLTVAPDGRILVRHMHDWNKYHVIVFDADGKLRKHDRVEGGLIGPLDSSTGGVRVDRAGNVYVSMEGHSDGMAKAERHESCVVKVRPDGGGLTDGKPEGKAGLAFGNRFFEGAVTAYPHLAPRQEGGGCVCKEARFDIDEFGRVYVPNTLDFSIRVYDNAGNLVTRFGHYGNADSAGPESAVPQPAIPLGWPMTVGVNRAGRVYVGDVANNRIVRIDPHYALERTVAVK